MSEHSRNVLEHVPPARREFLKRLLAGAAYATPVIATFSIDSLMDSAQAQVPIYYVNTTNTANACYAGDVGYEGPKIFQAHVSTGAVSVLPIPVLKAQHRVNGEVTFLLNVVNATVNFISVSIQMVPGATVSSATIFVGPLAATHPALSTTIFTINDGSIVTNVACDVDELADLMASGNASINVQGTFGGSPFSVSGAIIPAALPPPA